LASTDVPTACAVIVQSGPITKSWPMWHPASIKVPCAIYIAARCLAAQIVIGPM